MFCPLVLPYPSLLSNLLPLLETNAYRFRFNVCVLFDILIPNISSYLNTHGLGHVCNQQEARITINGLIGMFVYTYTNPEFHPDFNVAFSRHLSFFFKKSRDV